MAYSAVPTRSTADTNSFADINQLQENIRIIGGEGWLPAGETWTYASASTFTITGDLTAKYSTGMKIKLTQTTAKYFIISAVSYGAPNTTVTVNGGATYTVANAAITNPFYSVAQAPYGCPLEFSTGWDIGDVYPQWPIAASNTIATAFPTAQRPATRFGGTWEQVWNTDAVFFRTEGDFHVSDAQDTNRTNGKQTHQAQAWQAKIVNGGNTYYSDADNPGYNDTPNSAANFIQGRWVTTGQGAADMVQAGDDGTHGAPLTGYENRPQDRLFLLWKRTA